MKAIQITEDLHQYIIGHSPDVNPVLPELRAETRTLPMGNMQIAPEQGALMHLLAKLIGAKRIVEVGCFTGYSAICMGEALRHDGKLFTLDIDPETSAVANRYFAKANLSHAIELRVGDALHSLKKLHDEFGPKSFDMMFIDADKERMQNYFEWGLTLLRPGGLIIADNVLWSGNVVQKSDQSSETVAIRQFNEWVKKHPAVDSVMINVSDGLFLARVKS